jgi:hypothetical protein
MHYQFNIQQLYALPKQYLCIDINMSYTRVLHIKVAHRASHK